MDLVATSKVNDDDTKKGNLGARVTAAKSPASESESNDTSGGGDDDGGYDSDTQIVRIADSAASFARRCIASGELSKALLALQNVVQVAKQQSVAYAQCVLLLAQLFDLSGHADASLQCVLGVYKCMPAPYTAADGLVIIARIYERKGAQALAALWWHKLFQQQASTSKQQVARRKASAIVDFATRSFCQQDFVFALDAHRELFRKYNKSNNNGGLSYAFMHKYLYSALQVRDLAANYKSERLRLAWGFAHMGASLWDHHDYADPDLYNLRNVYFASFPEIYKAVFAWDDAPARVIALWWRACHERQLQQQQAELTQQSQLTSRQLPSSHQAKLKTRKKRGVSDTRPPETTRSQKALAKAFSTSPKAWKILSKPSRKRNASKRALEATTKDQRGARLARGDGDELEGGVTTKPTNQSEEHSTNQSPRPGFQLTCSHVARPLERSPPSAKRDSRTSREQRQDGGNLYESSPTKRKLSAVRRLRTQNLADELPHSKSLSSLKENDDDHVDKEDQGTDLHPSRTLLDVYALPSSPTAATASFLKATGRSSGFADLDLDELENYVRVAHYRARVLTQQHVVVTSLSEERVKPQWLLAFEKTEAMVASLQHQLKQPSPSTDDSPAAAKPHLTQIHSRVIFQLTAILKQYKRDFGDTRFTRKLHALVQRLGAWKYDQIPVLLAAMSCAKHAGVGEEKHRNLEFYHVHEGRKQVLGM